MTCLCRFAEGSPATSNIQCQHQSATTNSDVSGWWIQTINGIRASSLIRWLKCGEMLGAKKLILLAAGVERGESVESLAYFSINQWIFFSNKRIVDLSVSTIILIHFSAIESFRRTRDKFPLNKWYSSKIKWRWIGKGLMMRGSKSARSCVGISGWAWVVLKR
mgnify:CR=1 FL=1